LSGWKDWEIGEVVEAGEFQTFIQDQVVQVYADSAARGSALGTAVAEGMASYVKDTDSFEVYDGSGWVPVSVDAAWVTAGTAGQILISNGTADPSWVEAETTLAAGSAGELVVSAGTAGVVYEAAEATLTAGTSGFTALSAGTAGISYQPVSHNYIINGAFDFWQRATSFTNPANESFTSDRWRIFTSGTGATRTVSKQTFSPGDLAAIGFGDAESFLRIDTSVAPSGQTFYFFGTNLEDVRTLAGQTATISFYAKADTTRTLNLGAEQRFGSGGSTQVAVSGTAFSVGTTWQRYSVTLSIPSVSGKTIGANSFLRIFVQLNANLNVTSTIDIWGVQLEAGSVATPFKRNAPSLQGELAACQRYYQRIQADQAFSIYSLAECSTTTEAFAIVLLSTTLRAVPSVGFSAPGGFCLGHSGGTNTALTAIALQSATRRLISVRATVASGLTQGRVARFTDFTGSVGGSFMEIISEL
jgi:hypothetical protein